MRTLRGPALLHLAALAAALGALAASAPAAADEWLVYIGGGIVPIEGSWSERRGRVVYTKAGGTLVTVPFENVDLPASTFITWQVNGRRQVPPRAALEETPPPPAGDAAAPACVDARLVRLLGGESMEVATAEGREIVHVACLDTPESRHDQRPLAWFGRATLGAIAGALAEGSAICLREQTPPRRDGEGHRIVHVALEDGRDLAGLIIASGFGLLRPPQCGEGSRYRAAEDDAIAARRGLWGPTSAEPAFAAIRVGAAAVPPGSRGAARGCRLRR